MSDAASQHKRYALISVSNKTGLLDVARPLVEQYGYSLVATGGTAKALADANIPVTEVSEFTGAPEILEGRVKTLHPKVFAGILAKRNEASHMKDVEAAIDTVIVNLYPFTDALDDAGLSTNSDDEMVELIDIGGVSLLRAAAKNHAFVNVLSHPSQYEGFLQALAEGKGETALPYRRQLARESFAWTAHYEGTISGYFQGSAIPTQLSPVLSLPLVKVSDLRYGENPHQLAAVYGLGRRGVDYTCLHGKALSYNNILDMESAWALVNEFVEHPACAVIKHNQPCGVAVSTKSIHDAYRTAFHADPLSAFGGVVALNSTLDKATAEEMKDVFLEVIVAPDFEPEALEILQSKKNLRLVRYPVASARPEDRFQIKQVNSDQFLVQMPNPDMTQPTIEELFQVVTERKPTADELQDLAFAWRVVRHVKSNAMVLAKDNRTVGIGGGQTSRIGALEYAIKMASGEAKDAVLASDGFLPQEDNIHALIQERIGAIVQPGGSIKDKVIIELANKHNMAMVTTGVREFRH